jgi:hypothetical protein
VTSLLNNEAFKASSDLTTAHLSVYCTVAAFKSGKVEHLPQDVVDGFPEAIAVYERVSKLEKVQQWNAAHGQ